MRSPLAWAATRASQASFSAGAWKSKGVRRCKDTAPNSAPKAEGRHTWSPASRARATPICRQSAPNQRRALEGVGRCDPELCRAAPTLRWTGCGAEKTRPRSSTSLSKRRPNSARRRPCTAGKTVRFRASMPRFRGSPVAVVPAAWSTPASASAKHARHSRQSKGAFLGPQGASAGSPGPRGTTRTVRSAAPPWNSKRTARWGSGTGSERSVTTELTACHSRTPATPKSRKVSALSVTQVGMRGTSSWPSMPLPTLPATTSGSRFQSPSTRHGSPISRAWLTATSKSSWFPLRPTPCLAYRE